MEIKQAGKSILDIWEILGQNLGAEKDQFDTNSAADNNDAELNTLWRLSLIPVFNIIAE